MLYDAQGREMPEATTCNSGFITDRLRRESKARQEIACERVRDNEESEVRDGEL